MVGIRSWFFWPLTVLALCLVTLCVVVAVSLFRQQEMLARVFQENVASRRAAVELEVCLTDLIALEEAKVETVSPLHKRVREQMVTIESVTDQPEERELYAKIRAGFDEYIRLWRTMRTPGSIEHEATLREAARVL